MTRRRLTTLTRDERGATIIEFAIVAPVMLLLIMGLAELTYQGYMQAVLSGTMQKAGRDSTIEDNATIDKGAQIDSKVKDAIYPLSKTATFKSSRQFYSQFGNIAPEPFKDDNNNGVYDAATECFTDVNGNKTWDSDPGLQGQGGASDVVLYTMKVTYARIFPIAKMLGWSPNVVLTATTVLKNQPYKQQNAFTPTQVCP